MAKLDVKTSYELLRTVRQALMASPALSADMRESIRKCASITFHGNICAEVTICVNDKDDFEHAIHFCETKNYENTYRDLVEALEDFEHIAIGRNVLIGNTVSLDLLMPEQLAAYDKLMRTLRIVAEDLDNDPTGAKSQEAYSFLRLSTQCGGNQIGLEPWIGADPHNHGDKGWVLKTQYVRYWITTAH